jgi:acyl carrier protein
MQQLEHQIREVVSETFGIPLNELGESDLDFETHGIDEIDIVQLAMSLEERFHISMDDDQTASCRSIEQCLGIVQSLLNPEREAA